MLGVKITFVASKSRLCCVNITFFLVVRQKLITNEGFRASRRYHEIPNEILHIIHLTRAPEAFSKSRIRFPNLNLIKFMKNDGGDINNNNNNNNNNKVLVARGGPETANPARTGEALGDESLEDPQQTCGGKQMKPHQAKTDEGVPDCVEAWLEEIRECNALDPEGDRNDLTDAYKVTAIQGIRK